ncbi:MAG: universal stress protein [Chloroflexi bacterium]|nr:universal stress protein [Chloroflexota bacterium]
MAATLVGVELGLLDQDIFNGVVIMILITCVASPLIVERFGAGLLKESAALPKDHEARLDFRRILVSVSNPAKKESLTNLAEILANNVEGTLLPLYVTRLGDSPNAAELRTNRSRAQMHPKRRTSLFPLHRVDQSIASGILSEVIENHVNTIVIGWGQKRNVTEAMLGRILDYVVWNTPVPALVCKLTKPIMAHRRVLLILRLHLLSERQRTDIIETVTVITRALGSPLFALVDKEYLEEIEAALLASNLLYTIEQLRQDVTRQVVQVAQPFDLIVMATLGARQRFQSSLGRVPEQIVDQAPASTIVIRYPLI